LKQSVTYHRGAVSPELWKTLTPVLGNLRAGVTPAKGYDMYVGGRRSDAETLKVDYTGVLPTTAPPGAAVLGLTLSTLAMTRSMVNNGDAPNRIEALGRVIPEYLRGHLSEADPADEEIFGAAVVNTVRASQDYGYGLSVTVGIVGRFLPRQIFPNKDEYISFTDAFDYPTIRAETGLSIPYGSAPSGFANGFTELAWACPLIWMVVGYFYRRFWDKATVAGDMRSLGYLVGFMMAVFYALSQELITGEVNLIYVLAPLTVVYKLAKVPQARDLPELATR
jgi:hypothetical protein